MIFRRLALILRAGARRSTDMLTSSNGRLARLIYEPSGFHVVARGDHVLCAVSGVAIPLEQLRYWSADKQQAYASCAIATEAITGKRPADVAG